MPYIFSDRRIKSVMAVLAIIALSAFSNACFEEDSKGQDTPPGGGISDGDQEQITDANNSGNACQSTSPCQAGKQYCVYTVNTAACSGLCIVKGGESTGVCGDGCFVGDGCPSDYSCLNCNEIPQISGNCIPNESSEWFSVQCGAIDPGDGDEAETPEEENEDESPPVGSCQTESHCLENEHCDLFKNKCGPACNPLDPQCPNEQVCHVIVDGELAGQGEALCVEQISYGRNEGEFCVGEQLCKRELVCFLNDHCARVCDPESIGEQCQNNYICHPDPVSGVGVCSSCSNSIPCPDGYICNSGGQCEEIIYCDSWEDCISPLTCLSGICQDGCRIIGCSSGGCDAITGYCQEYCTPPCPDGQCCNDGNCGFCCDPPCSGLDICLMDASCEGGGLCCIPKPDCRNAPNPEEACPEGEICDPQTGRCHLDCNMSTCPWGYYCNALTGYQCVPIPPASCEIPFFTCPDPCMYCSISQLQCLPSYNCGIQCVPEGVSCGLNYSVDTPCCWGLQCLQHPDMYGYYICQ